MTATPRTFTDAVRDKAASHSAELASMDDEHIFGPEFHRPSFGDAVERGLLRSANIRTARTVEPYPPEVQLKPGTDPPTATPGGWRR